MFKMEVDVKLDFESNELHNVNKDVKSYVARPEILIAKMLIESKGDVVERAELLKHCWEGKVVTGSSLNVAVRNLRLALIDCGSSLIIITVPKQGYRIRKNDSDEKGIEIASKEGVWFSNVLEFISGDENEHRRVFLKIFSQLIFLSIFCFMLYTIIVPYQFENIRGVDVTSFGLLIDEKYELLFEYLESRNVSSVYMIPRADGCGNIQILASVNHEVVDLTNVLKLNDCEYF